jgi:predicted N-acetyltransferase YhbS
LMARLAVDQSVHGRGLGGALLRDALSRSVEISRTIGVHAVVVDALDGEAKAFYERFGFLPFLDGEMRLFLTLGTIRAAGK